MSTPPAPSGWSADLDGLRERLAERLRTGGARHPDTAAAALAARGLSHLGRTEFADRLDLTDEQLAAIESGDVPWSGCPMALLAEMSGSIGSIRSPGSRAGPAG
jgi:hypothetical protein